MPSSPKPGVWKQRKQGSLSFPEASREITLRDQKPHYLQPIQFGDSTEDIRYSFQSRDLQLQQGNYNFEEAFWFVPDLLEFVEYRIDPNTQEITIIPPATSAIPKTGAEKINFVFEKVLLNLTLEGNTSLSPATEHPCDADADGADASATTAGSNCLKSMTFPEDDNFLLFYLKDEDKIYRTDASLQYEVKFNNYLIPMLSADMSIWWYKIPNRFLDSDECARETAEEVLKVWHQDRKLYLDALTANPGMESKFYIGIYQRTYFCDELQMRFTNFARIGNDHTIPLEYDIFEYSGVTYQPLRTDLLS
ncbi:hypothetical protein [Haliscomenobacter hydrossis]|uniref:Uncharacterized protein n=1 Tax=Haliscomenobacter hydrossis (strain ATCC 27775 / DSM 1100 / LMG 10767 / O) TaxID=760192 RepID=F4L0Y3_HALH1|nr:hypothetical protein [Haliscomenobacter hydrossis]AEE50587.1 hypothetical protein Halhy_2719 [Haliscomenobacter hydrossis DSM 1100]